MAFVVGELDLDVGVGLREVSTGSTTFALPSIDDYAERTREAVAAWSGMDGRQGGDPAKLASVLVEPAGRDEPPARFGLSASLAHDPA